MASSDAGQLAGVPGIIANLGKRHTCHVTTVLIFSRQELSEPVRSHLCLIGRLLWFGFAHSAHHRFSLVHSPAHQSSRTAHELAPVRLRALKSLIFKLEHRVFRIVDLVQVSVTLLCCDLLRDAKVYTIPDGTVACNHARGRSTSIPPLT